MERRGLRLMRLGQICQEVEWGDLVDFPVGEVWEDPTI
jgi:hypothetical protein